MGHSPRFVRYFYCWLYPIGLAPSICPQHSFNNRKPAWVGNVGLTLKVQHFNGLANYGEGKKNYYFFYMWGFGWCRGLSCVRLPTCTCACHFILALISVRGRASLPLIRIKVMFMPPPRSECPRAVKPAAYCRLLKHKALIALTGAFIRRRWGERNQVAAQNRLSPEACHRHWHCVKWLKGRRRESELWLG